MGGAPTSRGVSARTFNRNFEGRSGTQDAQVYLVSPVTAAMLALRGEFSDPATWGTPPARVEMPADIPSIRQLFIFPKGPEDKGGEVEILRGPNIVKLERFTPLPAEVKATVAIKLGDNVTTDHILPGGAEVMALRSNIPAISRYLFSRVDKDFVARAEAAKESGGSIILGGENYGQGSSREHAALGPRHLGVRAVVAKSMARIHRANLVNFGILPLLLVDKGDYDALAQGQSVTIPTDGLTPGGVIGLVAEGGRTIPVRNDLTAKELEMVKAGGLLNTIRR
jgi:aconitate hydratase